MSSQHSGWEILPGEESAVIPEIKRTWDRANAVMPPANPTDPEDPSTNLATLAAIAHAKWTKCESLEEQYEGVVRDLAIRDSEITTLAGAYRILEEQLEAAQKALRRLAPLAPTGAANVHENHERQQAHREAIVALGLPEPLPEPTEFVRSDYWLCQDENSNPASEPKEER